MIKRFQGLVIFVCLIGLTMFLIVQNITNQAGKLLVQMKPEAPI